METRHLSDTAIIIRATKLDNITRCFANELKVASGYDVVFLLDARFASDIAPSEQAILLSADACRKLNLYTPSRFAWQCGDYCFYLARNAYPNTKIFWLIEYDVRFAPGMAKGFFQRFAQQPADVLAVDLRRAERWWWWYDSARGKGVTTFRCLFPVVRMTNQAIDLALTKRVSQSRNLLRRLVWPNDESFIATTIYNSTLLSRDFRDLDPATYDPESFSFHSPIKGETHAEQNWKTTLLHPVLFGEAYDRKLDKLSEEEANKNLERRWRRVIGALTAAIAW